MSSHPFGISDKELLDVCLQDIDSDEAISGNVVVLSELISDPVERIEYEYGSKDSPWVGNLPLPAFWNTWDEKRLEIATNPEYMDRARESYAFQDLLGREYNGVVFD